MRALDAQGSPGESVGGRLGMLGGTYDPPHVGHLIVAQDVLEQLALDRLLIIPAGEPPHRAALLPTEVRLDLVSQAFGGDPRFEVSRIEVDRAGGGDPAPQVLTPDIRTRLDRAAALAAGP